MVIASVWGFQRVCSSHPQCTAESLRINRQPTSVFPTTRKKAHDSQCITCSLSASLSTPSAAGGGCFSSTVDLGGLVMSPSRAAGEEIDAQWQDPHNMSSSVSRDGSIQGLLPQWAIGRTEQPVAPPKLLTLVIIQKHGKVLLGMKKRGFGKGYFNGFGGKVEKGETVDAAAARELQEEAGVRPVDMSERGILTFHFDNDPVAWEVHVYHVSDIVGDPCETEEMEPRWFAESEIPYETMWQDDILWYPEFLKGRHFKGSFYFENTTTLVAHSLQVIPT